MVATDLLRERCAHFMPDSRLPRSELQAQFGGLGGRAAIDFGSVDEDDTPFLNGHERHEPEARPRLDLTRASHLHTSTQAHAISQVNSAILASAHAYLHSHHLLPRAGGSPFLAALVHTSTHTTSSHAQVGSPLLAQRAEAALRWLASLPATYAAVAVVSHKHFLGAITGVHAETVAQRPFANAERRTVLLCDGGGADGGGADGATVKPVRARVKPYGAAT
jgi:hypothetical protein